MVLSAEGALVRTQNAIDAPPRGGAAPSMMGFANGRTSLSGAPTELDPNPFIAGALRRSHNYPTDVSWVLCEIDLYSIAQDVDCAFSATIARSQEVLDAVFRTFADVRAYAHWVASRGADRGVLAYRDYSEFVEIERQVFLTLSADPAVAVIGSGCFGDRQLSAIEEDWIKKILSKLLLALGLKDIWNAFSTVLTSGLAPELAALGAAASVEGGVLARISAIRAALWNLIAKIGSPAFMQLLIRQIGPEAAGKIARAIGGRAVPFIGWGLLVGEFAWAIYNQKPEP